MIVYRTFQLRAIIYSEVLDDKSFNVHRSEDEGLTSSCSISQQADEISQSSARYMVGKTKLLTLSLGCKEEWSSWTVDVSPTASHSCASGGDYLQGALSLEASERVF